MQDFTALEPQNAPLLDEFARVFCRVVSIGCYFETYYTHYTILYYTILTRKVRMTGAPSYLSQHLVQHVATRQTRSMALPLLTIPRTNTEFARRSYSYSAPFIWNSLPGDVLNCNLEHTFKKHLKTFLFNSCFYAA